MLTAGVISLSFLNIVLALIVTIRSTRSKTNVAFASFAIITAAWMVANYFGANFKDQAFSLVATRGDFLLGPWITYTFWALTYQFLSQATHKASKLRRFINQMLLLLIVGFSLGSLLPVIAAVGRDSNGVLDITYGPLFLGYGIVIISGALFGLVNLLIARAKASGHLKNQINSLLFGLAVLAALLALPNLVLPLISTSKSANLIAGDIAYLGIAAFVLVSFSAIVRHHMFDMRMAIMRTLGFIFTLTAIASLYSLLAIGASALFIENGSRIYNDTAIISVLFVSTFTVALTFRYVQNAIVRATRKIFRQDPYDLRDILDRLSEQLVAQTEIDKIMQSSLDIIGRAIKPSGAYFVVFTDTGKIYKDIERNAHIPAADLHEISAELQKLGTNLTIIDDVVAPGQLKQINKHQISLALWLGEASNPRGLIVFTQKQNGRPYTKADVGLLSIISKNLKVGLENAMKYEQISHFADTLKLEVDHATAKLRRANSRLKSLDVLKNDFMSMASHQLRSPATSVHEALHMLNHPALDDKDREDLIALAEANSERLVTVVKTMLNMARLQAGRFTIDRSEEDITVLAGKVIEQTNSIASQRGVKLNFLKPAKPVIALVDAAKITEAMANYVENAIKYSPKGSTVQAELKESNGRIIFEVTDSGMGVPISERKNLFGKFYRATNARQEEPDGNGIGLYVVHSIAHGHGGDSYYKPLKTGSLFGFWITHKHVTES
jgi:K+-sensing histidine kinase KdpD